MNLALELMTAGILISLLGRDLVLQLGKVECHVYGVAQARRLLDGIHLAASKPNGEGVQITPTIGSEFDRAPINIIRAGEDLVFQQSGRSFKATPAVMKLIDRKLSREVKALHAAA